MARDLAAAAPRMPALVLGGGGAFGVIQAAYVHAALDRGFRPAVVVGTSVGALNAAWVAMHPDRPDELLHIWLKLDELKLLRLNPMRIAARLLRHPVSITANDLVPRLLDQHLAGATFEDTQIPLAVVATNLTRSRKHVFRSGSLRDAIIASTAIPGVFEPHEVNGELFLDGGLTASVDLATAVDMGATEILAIDLTPAPPTDTPKTALGVLRHSLGIMSHATTDAMQACLERQLPVRVLRPDLSRSSAWRMEDSAGAIAHNLKLARLELAAIFDSDGCLTSGVGSSLTPRPEPLPLAPSRFFHPRRHAG